MPAPHPIPHQKADEAETGRPLTWAERVANGPKASPEVLQKDGGRPAPRRLQGRLPPTVGPAMSQRSPMIPREPLMVSEPKRELRIGDDGTMYEIQTMSDGSVR